MTPERLFPRLDSTDQVEDEERIRALVAAGDVGAGVAGVLRLYGAEVYGFLVALLDEHASRDIYARVSARLSATLPTCPRLFRLRTWMYMLARHELARHREATGPSPEPAPDTVLITPPSSPFRQASFSSAVSVLRRHLPPDEQEILVLRVDRRLSWTSIALTGLTGMGEHASEEAIAEERRRARGKFTEARAKLTRIAARHGILTRR